MTGAMAAGNSGGPRATWLIRSAWWAIFVAGALLRVADAGRPFDGRSLAAWREADYTGIARAFARESLDLLHPRVDWRGETPGFAEMELPVLPWIAGALDRCFGENELRMRWMSAVASLAALLVFARLAKTSLPPAAALAATAFFAVQPLLLYLAPAMQPDGLMVLLGLLAVARLWRYERDGRTRDLVAAALLTGAATLVKAPAALLGLLLVEAVLRRHGARALLRREVFVAAACAVVPAAAWYGWSHQFWLQYGLSLGLSNETHRVSLAVLSSPDTFRGNVRVELHQVFTWPGLALVGAALLLRPRELAAPLRWGAAVALFYFLMLDTSGDSWAFYYHALSSAPAALLMGAGFGALLEAAARRRTERPRFARALQAVAIVLALATLAAATRAALALRAERDEQEDLPRAYACAERFRDLVPAGARIVFCGGRATDRHGHPVAHNGSTWFAWLDRRGANYVEGEVTLARLEQYAAHGPTFWIAAEHEIADPQLLATIEARHRLVEACNGDFRLYELRAAR